MAHHPTPTDREAVRFRYEEARDFSMLDELFEQDYAPAPCRAIHMGCGRGHVAVNLSQRGFRVVGIDPDRDLLASARERARMAEVELDLMAGDPLDLPPIPGESIGLNVDLNTAVTMADGLPREDFLRIVFRYMTRGGIVLAAGPLAEEGPDESFAFGTPFVADFTRTGFEILMQGIRTLPEGERRLVVHARKPA